MCTLASSGFIHDSSFAEQAHQDFSDRHYIFHVTTLTEARPASSVDAAWSLPSLAVQMNRLYPSILANKMHFCVFLAC